MNAANAESLKETVFRRVQECRESLEHGNTNLSGLEDSVRAYCEAVARLPKGEGREHMAGLEALMQQVNALSGELERARESVKREIEGLSRLKAANVAYHKTDAMGPAHRPKNEDE